MTTVMPLLYGGILASITYLLFLGCILTGEGVGGLFTSNLFPTFENLVCGGPPQGASPPDMAEFIQVRPRQVEDIAKILIWSLIAGYSEKFVDQVLRTLEQRGQQ